MAAPYLNQYVAPFNPVSNITPFTIKDGYTYLEVLELLRTYVNSTLVTFVNENFTALGADFEEQVNILIIQVNEAIANLVGEDAEINDAVVAAIINDTESLSRDALDTLYGGQVTDAAVAARIDDTLTSAAVLAVTAGYAGQVTDAAVAARIDDTLTAAAVLAVTAGYAGQVTDAAVAGRVDDALTAAAIMALTAGYAGQVTDAAVAGRIDDTLTSAAILTLTAAYAGQVTDAAVAARLDDTLSKAVLDAAYIANNANGILVPTFDTAGLPDPTGLADGLMAFDNEAGSLMVIVSEEWVVAAGGGGGIEIPAWGYISIGNNPTAPSSSWPALTIGNDAVNDAPVSIALGDSTQILGGGAGANSIAIGYGAQVGDTGEAHGGGIAIGQSANASKTGGGGNASVAVGQTAVADGTYAVALGGGSSATADETVSIGAYSDATADSAVAVGQSANASGVNSIALGYSATASGENSVMIGQGTNSDDDTFKIAQETIVMPGLTLSVEDSYLPVINGGVFGPLVRSSAPLDIDALVVGVCYFDATEGKPLWLKTIEVDPADNVWVDAAGTEVYPAP